jgi:hypothetical protein
MARTLTIAMLVLAASSLIGCGGESQRGNQSPIIALIRRRLGEVVGRSTNARIAIN